MIEENTAGKLRVAVIGAGPAGTRAAATLAKAGLRPVVIDEGVRSGGQIYRRQPDGFTRTSRDLYGFEAEKADRLHSCFDGLGDTVGYRPRTLVWNREGKTLYLADDNGIHTIEADRFILATGAMDRIAPVPGWTASGVYSLGGAQVSLKHQACAIGKRPVFVGSGPLLYLIAWQYTKAGAPPAAVIDFSRFSDKLRALPHLAANPTALAKGIYFSFWLKLKGIPVYEGASATSIEADDHGFRVHFRNGQHANSVAGDAVAIGYGLKPETQLADLFNCPMEYDDNSGYWIASTDSDGRSGTPDVYIAGDCAGIRGADAAEVSGELAALALLKDAGLAVDLKRMGRIRRMLTRFERFRRGLERAFPYPWQAVADLPDETVICRCEVIRAGTLRQAAAHWGVSEMNRLKAVTRCGMGRCQGRLCGIPASQILAAVTGQEVARTGRLRGQAPIKPFPRAIHARSDSGGDGG